jgi:hypothetical protein
MYQTLICPFVGAGMLRDHPRGLRAPLDAENPERLADALIDGVRRNPELDRDFLGAQMLVDEAQAVELTGRQSGYARGH